jgi:hypothetical protein
MGAPFIVRVAGLSADLLEPFASPVCIERIGDHARLEAELASLRAEIVEQLYGAIHEVPPSSRRFLLTVKRDCFNGRSLARYRDTAEWPQLGQTAVDLAKRVLCIEERLTAWQGDFAELFSTERDRQHEQLLAFLDDPSLRRGIALASPELLRGMDRLRLAGSPPPERKERKLEESLLRYVSRAAFKLSPFSTLTRVGLGQVEEDFAAAAPGLIGAHWREASLTRLKRYRLNQLNTLVLRHPAFRAGLRVEINDTVEEIGSEQYRFLRPGWYARDPASSRFRYFNEALVKASLSGPMISWLLAELPGREMTFEELVGVLQRLFESAGHERIEGLLVKLLDLGFLQLLPPWPGNEPHLERRLLAALRGFENDPVLGPLLTVVERLVALAAGFPSAVDPVQVIEQVDHELAAAWDVARSLAALGPEVKPDGAKNGINEDIFLSPTDRSASPAVFRLPVSTADRMQRSIEAIVRFSHLFDNRHDFRHALEAILSARWPGRREVPFTEAFNVLQPLIREYTEFAAAHRQGGLENAFNPQPLEAMTRLQELRRSLWDEATACVRSEAGETRIPLGRLEALVQRIPVRYTPGVGACLFVQPADVEGNLWVLNRMLDGTGRYGSRYTAAMDAEVREDYTRHFTLRSNLEQDGEPVELLDLMWSQADNLNIHAVQTPRVLELPGERVAEVPVERRVRLCDLRIRLGDPEGVPCLVDGQGRRLLPVYLGTMTLRLMPPILKFLALLGPSDFAFITPPRGSRRMGDMEVQDRLTIGSLVLMRRRWIVPVACVAQEVAGITDAAAFVRLNQWRSLHGIPERVFVAEKTPLQFLGGEVRKPQYLDFTSPLFLTVIRSVLKTEDRELILEEMLPLPSAYPTDAAGRRWAVELQLDTLALRSVSPRPALPMRRTEQPLEAMSHTAEVWSSITEP